MHPAILVGAGFLAGTAGLKAITSSCAKKVYIKGMVGGMRAKEGVQTLIDEAKAEFDDLVAEANVEMNGTVIEDASADAVNATEEADQG